MGNLISYLARRVEPMRSERSGHEATGSICGRETELRVPLFLRGGPLGPLLCRVGRLGIQFTTRLSLFLFLIFIDCTNSWIWTGYLCGSPPPAFALLLFTTSLLLRNSWLVVVSLRTGIRGFGFSGLLGSFLMGGVRSQLFSIPGHWQHLLTR